MPHKWKVSEICWDNFIICEDRRILYSIPETSYNDPKNIIFVIEKSILEVRIYHLNTILASFELKVKSLSLKAAIYSFYAL